MPPPHGPRPLAVLGALGLCLGGPVAATAGTPLPEFQTITTPHFRVHAPVGLSAYTNRAVRILEEAHATLVPLLHHAPTERTEVSISDYGDSANGSATALPANRMTLLAAPPTVDGNLGDYDDWLRQLIYHEYTHILHLDTVHGVPAALNAVLGKRFAPNQNMPSFLIEGTAVYVESATSGRGRVRSGMFRGWLLTAAHTGSLHDLDVATHFPLRFPSANVWYMYGGHFMDWVARHEGSDAIARLMDAYGHDVMPFAVNRAAQVAMGKNLTDLWAAWQADLRDEAAAEFARRGLASAVPGVDTPALRTTTGYRHENPRFLPDGRLLSTEADTQLEADVYVRGPRGEGAPETYLHLDATERFDVCRRSGDIVLDQVEPFRGQYAFSDLWLWDGHEKRRLTRGARLRDPGCAPDGRWAVAVKIDAGRTRLVRVDLHDGHEDALWDPGGIGQVGHPAVSPDGKTVVFLVTQNGRRDLAALALDVPPGAPGRFRWRTDDDALELRPRFMPDGEDLIYASDRTGLFELYRGPVAGGANDRRLTRSLGGVIEGEPSPDGRSLAVIAITPGGQDLGYLDPANGQDLGASLDRPPGRPRRPDMNDAPLPTRPYDASESLWPTAWGPKIALSSPESNAQQFGLTFDSTDALAHHAFVGDFTTRPDAGGYAARLAWGYRRHVPNFGLSASHETRVRPDAQRYAGATHDQREDVTAAGGSVGLGVNRGGHAGAVTARYSAVWVRPTDNPAPVFDALDEPPVLAEPARSTDLTVAMRYRNTGRFLESIAEENGFSLGATLRLRDPLLGSRAQTAEAFLDYQHYVGLWWRHVLAWRLTTAFSAGDRGRPIYYALAAAPERNLLLDALDQIAFGSTFLRGFPAGTVVGTRYALASAEYRLPLLTVFRGLSMVPVFMRDLQLAAFTDWAQASTASLDVAPDAFYKAVGAELGLHGLLGWRLPLDARLGYAYGFGREGESQVYFFLGNWF